MSRARVCVCVCSCVCVVWVCLRVNKYIDWYVIILINRCVCVCECVQTIQTRGRCRCQARLIVSGNICLMAVRVSACVCICDMKLCSSAVSASSVLERVWHTTTTSTMKSTNDYTELWEIYWSFAFFFVCRRCVVPVVQSHLRQCIARNNGV